MPFLSGGPRAVVRFLGVACSSPLLLDDDPLSPSVFLELFPLYRLVPYWYEGNKLHTVMSVRAEDEITMALLRKVRKFWISKKQRAVVHKP